MDAQLCEKKNVSQYNGTRILPVKYQSTVRGFLTVHINNHDITTCSYDVIMRKRQVLNLTLTLRVPHFSLLPKQFALCQMCSNI